MSPPHHLRTRASPGQRRLTALEAVGPLCTHLRTSGLEPTFGPRLVRRNQPSGCKPDSWRSVRVVQAGQSHRTGQPGSSAGRYGCCTLVLHCLPPFPGTRRARTIRSVGVSKSSGTVRYWSWAGPIFQGRPHLSAVIRRLGSSVGNSRYGPYRSPTALAAQVGTVRLSSSWTNLPDWSSWMVPHRGELQPELHPP